MSSEEAASVAWLLVCSALVFVMQTGFACLEAGFTRSKNSINVAIKNATDFAVSGALFWAFGFGLMFGPTLGGWLGTPRPFGGAEPGDHLRAAFFLFQLMFCATSTTIVSGAVAERMRFSAYLIVAATLSGIVYTLFGHWAWAPGGWLKKLGFVDFAGSTVVHSVGGWVSLALVLILGPREGRFSSEAGRAFQGYNIPLSVVGTLLLWMGWFGFNGGSTFALNAQVPGIMINTTLAGAGGMLAALITAWTLLKRPDVTAVLNGSLAGLVSVTAACHAVTASEAILIGGAGGLIMVGTSRVLERLKIDDVVGAIPVHGFCGIWGTLCVALFGAPERLGTGLGWGGQLAVQLLGVGVCAAWTFGLSFALFNLLNRRFRLRVTPEQERIGLNVAEHGASTEIHDLLAVMDRQSRSQDLSLRAPVQPFTEVGEIAALYNRVLDTLQRVLAQTDAVVRTAMDGILTFARSGGVITSVNPSAERMFGYAPGHLVGQPLSALVDPSGTSALEDVMRAPQGGIVRELRARRPDGSAFPVEMVVTRADISDGMICVATVRDISERNRYEEELRAALRAARTASQAKSQFLASMSHELRTPLNSIIGFSNVLLKNKAGALAPQDAAYLQRILDNGKHLLALINSILDLSKVEAGKMELNLSAVAVDALARETVAQLEGRVVEKGVRLVADLPPEVAPIQADAEKLKQVLINLLGNAIKFTDAGSVTVRVRVDPATKRPVRLEVADTGIGIPAHLLDRIFEAFQQGDTGASRKYEGTGLGLAISQALCTLMGYRIEVQSEVGKGSTFSIVLAPPPGARAPVSPRPAAPAEAAEDEDLRDKLVLVVDDEEDSRILLRQYISDCGCRVEEATSGLEALARARELRPDLITLDLMMPGMNGWEILRNLKADGLLREVPVVVVSIAGRENRGTIFGAADLLNKPVSREELCAVLRRNIRPGMRKVLVVDDDPIARRMLAEFLHPEGVEVVTAENGEQALGLLEQPGADLVILDLMMPVMDGMTFLGTVRADPRYVSLPVVVVTAKELTLQEIRRMEAGVSAVLKKGDELRAALARVVRTLLRRPPAPSGRILVKARPMIADMIPGFLEARRREVDSLLAALERGDLETIRTLGHNMKGVGSAYGFEAITDIGRKLEEAAQAGQRDEVHVQTQALADYLARVEVVPE